MTTDKTLEAAADAFAMTPRVAEGTTRSDLCFGFLSGAAWQKERMRCEGCKHDLKAWTCAKGVVRPPVTFHVPCDFGCVLFEGRDA
jgi:hypothetical protein